MRAREGALAPSPLKPMGPISAHGTLLDIGDDAVSSSFG